MNLTTDPLTIAAYGTYQRRPNEGGGDMKRGDGSSVEFVEVYDELSLSVDAGLRRFTLDRAINGSRPAVGDVVVIELRDWIEAEAKIGAGGRPYVGRKRRNVAVGFAPAK